MKDDINGLIFCGFIFLLLLVISMVLRSGRGAWLINMYTFMSAKNKAKYNEKALCMLFGNLLLIIDFILLLAIIAGIFEITWLIITLCLVIVVISIIATIYAYTNVRFRK